MPLSDREQQILQEIENQLYEQDPDFARGVSSTTLQGHLVRNIRRGVAAFLAGFIVLIIFFFRPALPIGIAAFLLMLAAAIYTYEHVRKLSSEQLKLLKAQAPLANALSRLRTKLREMGPRQNGGSGG
jgi:hypothetical protein